MLRLMVLHASLQSAPHQPTTAPPVFALLAFSTMCVLPVRCGESPARSARRDFPLKRPLAGTASSPSSRSARDDNLSEKPKCFDAVEYCTYRASLSS